MRRLMKNNHADVKMIGMVVAIFVTLMVSVIVVFTMASNTSFTTEQERSINAARGYTVNTDSYNNSTAAGNSSGDILSQAGTFFQIAPIIGIVVVAVVILGYVSKIGG